MILRRRKRMGVIGFCACGCGQHTSIIPFGAKTAVRLWGTPKRFVAGHNRRGRGVPFDEMYEVDPVTGCWLWRGAIGTHGYGVFSRGSKTYTAHRYSYIRTHGPVPKGLLVLHSCDERVCVNPAHLSAGSYSRNIQEAWDRNRRTLLSGSR